MQHKMLQPISDSLRHSEPRTMGRGLAANFLSRMCENSTEFCLNFAKFVHEYEASSDQNDNEEVLRLLLFMHEQMVNVEFCIPFAVQLLEVASCAKIKKMTSLLLSCVLTPANPQSFLLINRILKELNDEMNSEPVVDALHLLAAIFCDQKQPFIGQTIVKLAHQSKWEAVRIRALGIYARFTPELCPLSSSLLRFNASDSNAECIAKMSFLWRQLADAPWKSFSAAVAVAMQTVERQTESVNVWPFIVECAQKHFAASSADALQAIEAVTIKAPDAIRQNPALLWALFKAFQKCTLQTLQADELVRVRNTYLVEFLRESVGVFFADSDLELFGLRSLKLLLQIDAEAAADYEQHILNSYWHTPAASLLHAAAFECIVQTANPFNASFVRSLIEKELLGTFSEDLYASWIRCRLLESDDETFDSVALDSNAADFAKKHAVEIRKCAAKMKQTFA